MEPSPPQPTLPSSRIKLRPWYLVAAMILTWFVGVRGMDFGLSTAVRLRAGTTPDIAEIARKVSSVSEAGAYGGVCAVQAMLDHPRVTFPLAVAQLILSGLLVVASFLAMGGRQRGLALQAIFANAVLAALAFAMTPFVRAAMIDGVTQAVSTLTVPADPAEAATVGQLVRMARWIMPTMLSLYLVALAIGAIALTRPRVKRFFDAVAGARPTEIPPGAP